MSWKSRAAASASLLTVLSIGAPAGAQEEPFEPGPPQEAFLCTTLYQGLGQPIVDNQEQRGTPVYPESAPDVPDLTQDPVGWSEQCQAEPVVDYRYRTTVGRPARPPDRPAARRCPPTSPCSPSTTCSMPTRWRLGGRHRGARTSSPPSGARCPTPASSTRITMLAGPVGLGPDVGADPTLVERAAGVLLQRRRGHRPQPGRPSAPATPRSTRRCASATPSSTPPATAPRRTTTSCSPAAPRWRPRTLFVERYGDPLYTVGIGGSGRRHPAVRVRPEPPGPARRPHPAVLVPGHDHPDHQRRRLRAARPLHGRARRRQRAVAGLGQPRAAPGPEHASQGFESDWQALTGAPGSTECIEGWRGSTPLAMNPTFGLAAEMEEVVVPYVGEILGRIAAGEPGYPEDFPDLGRLLRTHEDPERVGGLDALAGRRRRLRRRRGIRVRPGPVGQRRRPVRPPVGGPGAHHPRGVPRPQRPGRHLVRARGRRARELRPASRP